MSSALNQISPPLETRQLLLEAAAEVFATTGFRDATVREICSRANANIAAVNYYFGDKLALYLEVVRQSAEFAAVQHPVDLGVRPDSPHEERLATFVRAMLFQIFDTAPGSFMGRLMLREMIEPTPALDEFVANRVRRQSEMLRDIVRGMLGPDANPATVLKCALSVVSQCLFYHHCRPVLERLFPDLSYETAEIEKIAAHITAFSLAGIRGQLPSGSSR